MKVKRAIVISYKIFNNSSNTKVITNFKLGNFRYMSIRATTLTPDLYLEHTDQLRTDLGNELPK